MKSSEAAKRREPIPLRYDAWSGYSGEPGFVLAASRKTEKSAAQNQLNLVETARAGRAVELGARLQRYSTGAEVGLTESGIGEALRAERLRQRRTIEYIARETRISPRMLDAIERDDLEALPGLIFTRNFVKQYALALGLDPAPLLGALPPLDIESAPLPQPPEREREKPAWNPAWNGAIASVVWILLAGGAAVAAYIHFSRPVLDQMRQERAETTTPEPGPQPKPAPAPVTNTAPQATATDRETRPATQAAPPVSPPPAVSQTAPVRDVADTKPAETTAGDEANANSPHKINVVIHARADSWIEVSEDGKALFSGILKPNESRQFSSNDAIKLVAGNAGGITVSLNGRSLDPLGAEGQVKILRLTEAGPQALAREAQPAPNQL